MTTTFKPAKRENVPLLIGLDGASGSGKTYSALLLADGIAGEIGKAHNREGRVFFIDTERGRGLHYADDFAFMHAEINPPFRPDAYGKAIADAEKAGADVIVIDSFSHEWEGEGGVREWAAELEPQNKAPKNWMVPKQAHKRLVNQMLAAKAHIIVCLRSEEKMKIEAVPQYNDDGSPKMWNGKPSTKMVITPSAELPMLERWVAICEKRFPFEITTSLLLSPDHPGIPIPRKLQEQHRAFFPQGQRITREAGAALARWSMGGAAPKPATIEEAKAALEAAADMDALKAAWSSPTVKPHQTALRDFIEQQKSRFTTNEPASDNTQQPPADAYDGV